VARTGRRSPWACAPGPCACRAGPGDLPLPGIVELAEISGSDSFVHVRTPIGELVSQLPGVHVFTLGSQLTLHLSPEQVYVFDAKGELCVRPRRRGGAHPAAGVPSALRWPASTSIWRTPTCPNPQRDEDYALLPLKMCFEDGGAYALLGPSGCGKTTC
jgi:hypothetical protein